MRKPNADFRKYAKSKHVCLWQIAEAIGISESAFYYRLRKQMTDAETERLKQIADELSLTD